jgi:rhodanese-related sulfurtransferase
MNDSNASLGPDREERFRIREITPYQLAGKKPLPMIIDIREEEEFMRGHIDGAKHISRGDLEQKIAEVAPEHATPIVVYCAVGNRGPLAAEKLHRMGYRNISSLKGGLRNWLEAGGMVECPKSGRNSFAGIR